MPRSKYNSKTYKTEYYHVDFRSSNYTVCVLFPKWNVASSCIDKCYNKAYILYTLQTALSWTRVLLLIITVRRVKKTKRKTHILNVLTSDIYSVNDRNQLQYSICTILYSTCSSFEQLGTRPMCFFLYLIFVHFTF